MGRNRHVPGQMGLGTIGWHLLPVGVPWLAEDGLESAGRGIGQALGYKLALGSCLQLGKPQS